MRRRLELDMETTETGKKVRGTERWESSAVMEERDGAMEGKEGGEVICCFDTTYLVTDECILNM